MAVLLTLQQACDHLRITLDMDGSPAVVVDDRAADLQLKLDAAEAAVLDLVDTTEDALDGSPALYTDPQLLQMRAAVLMLLSAYYDDAPDRTATDYLRPGGMIHQILMRIRKPVLA
jgi:hypothetical protein